MTMSEITYEDASPVESPSVPAATVIVDRIWPKAVIAFGLGLTAAWICLLGYGIAKLVEMAI
jgi:hypothetical protein